MGNKVNIPFYLDLENQINKQFNRSKKEDLINNIKLHVIKDNKRKFFDLGIHAAGFLFVNPWEGGSVFLADFYYKDNEQYTYNTPYHFYNKKLDQESNIQDLFKEVRTSQKINSKGAEKDYVYDSDFFKYLPTNNSDIISADESSFRSDYNVHYCTLGEILYTCFCWRFLSNDFENPEFDIKWNNKSVKIDDDIIKILNSNRENIHKTEFENLKLVDNEGSFNHFNIEAIVNFLKGCNLEEKSCSEIIKKNDTYTKLYEFLKSHVNSFLTIKLKCNVDLQSLEKNARFPILPYYIWNAIDTYIHTYLVLPIWKSINNSFNFKTINNESEKKSTHIVGYALSASAILEELDWTLPKNYNKTGYSKTPFLLIKHTLEVLSNPLVELAFYENLKDEMIRIKEKEVIAGIMARNLSHNFGSHILGNSHLYDNLGIDAMLPDKTINERRVNLVKFHHYLQARLDFIARIISDAPKQLETVFFFSDLLDKFMLQEALIDTIAIDNGYGKDNMEFCIKIIENSIAKKYTYIRNEKSFLSTEKFNNRAEDFLIAIPGGITGCHAFYSIVENIIRNAVKYGDNSKKKLIINIELTKDEADFNVIIYDNLSNISKVDEINKLLDSSIIGSDGKDLHKGNGIWEIKKCAEFLYNKNLNTTKDKIIQAINHNKGLAYRFYIHKPIIIGYYSINDEKKYNINIKKSKTENILEYISLEEFSNIGAYFGLFIDNINDKTSFETYSSNFIDYLKKSHYKLPYRLMLFVSNEEIKLKWQSTLQAQSNLNSQRVKVVINNEFISKLKNANVKTQGGIIIDLYEIWIKAYKPLINNEKYNLIIGFESTVKQSWTKILDKIDSQIVDIYIGGKNLEGSSATNYTCSKNTDEKFRRITTDSDESYLNQIILYNNHGNCFTELAKKKILFKHNFSINNSELYQELQNPPTSPFSFKFFIYSLIEASLTNVLILDERLTNSLKQGDKDKTDSLRDVLINIVNKIHNENGFIEVTNESKDVDGILNLEDNETFFEFNEKKTNEFDAFIIHHGKFEEFQQKKNFSYKDLDLIFDISPVLLWTSGRGYDLNRGGHSDTKLNAQFIDFNEVNYSTYLTLNKFELGRAILSKYGNVDL